MKLCVVTSVYHLRKTRPLEYYLTPAIHLLEDFSESDVDVKLFTDLPFDLFPIASNLTIIHKTPTEFAEDMWGDPNWKSVYQTALNDRPDDRFEEKHVPELIAIWLGKLTMMEMASQNADCVLWQDSGIRMGGPFEKNASLYNRGYSNPNKYRKTADILTRKYPTVFMECDGYVNPYHGIDMKKYETANQGYHVRGGFILAKSSEMSRLKSDVKGHWNNLISNGDYGTEENPLTICQWERPESSLLTYSEWLSLLNIGHNKQANRVLF